MKNLYLLIAIAALLFTISLLGLTNLFTIEVNGQLRSNAKPVVQPLQGLKNTFDSWGNLSNVYNDNEKLHQQVEDLTLQLNSYAQLSKTLDTIKATGAKQQDIVNILNPLSTLTEGYFYIDQGSNQGVQKNDLVIYGQYLVGTVNEVGLNFSKVISVTATNSQYAVAIGGHFGTARGLANLGVKVDELDPRANVQIGDDINLLPTNDNPLLGKYKLGKVKKKLTAESAATQTVEVDYPLDLFNLAQAEIVRHK